MKFGLFLLSFSLAGQMAAQVAQQANEGYKTPEGRAQVGGGLASANREKTQRPRDLIAAMEVKPGMTVADIGTGVGFMLPYFSEAVGEKGKVVAEDIFPDFLDKARQRASEKKLPNVDFVLGDTKDAKLREGTVDRALVLDVYHHFDYPAEMLASIAKGLKPDGRLVIVEYYKRKGAMGGDRALTHIRLDEDDAIREIESNGFKLLSKSEFNPNSQWIGVFVKK
jgi:ubiquinone/menaquinone biosynthesis C-methylase UbiE